MSGTNGSFRHRAGARQQVARIHSCEPGNLCRDLGDESRFNPHLNAIGLEGGFDEEGRRLYIPFPGLQSMVELTERTGPKRLQLIRLHGLRASRTEGW